MTVDLEPAQQGGSLTPSRRAGVPGRRLEGERVVEALHALEVVDWGEAGGDRAPTLLGRRVMRGARAVRFEPSSRRINRSNFGVVDGRAVQDGEAPSGVPDLLGDPPVLARVGVGRLQVLGAVIALKARRADSATRGQGSSRLRPVPGPQPSLARSSSTGRKKSVGTGK